MEMMVVQTQILMAAAVVEVQPIQEVILEE